MGNATGARGETTIQLPDGEQATLLFTNQALAQGERLTGKTMMALVTAAQSNDIGIQDVAHLLQVGMEFARRDAGRAGKPVTPQQAWDVLERVGFGTCAAAVLEGVATVLGYSGEQAGPLPE